jgi:hypothetical protein
VGAHSHRDTSRDDLDDAAERVSVLLRGIDLGNHGCAGGRIDAAHGVCVQTPGVPGRRRRDVVGQGDGSDAYDVADQPDAGDLSQDGLGQRPERHSGGRLTG